MDLLDKTIKVQNGAHTDILRGVNTKFVPDHGDSHQRAFVCKPVSRLPLHHCFRCFLLECDLGVESSQHADESIHTTSASL